jgi:hypothetical protein
MIGVYFLGEPISEGCAKEKEALVGILSQL